MTEQVGCVWLENLECTKNCRLVEGIPTRAKARNHQQGLNVATTTVAVTICQRVGKKEPVLVQVPD